MKPSTLISASVLAFACADQAAATPTPLALRCESNGVYIHGTVTSQTLEGTFGTNSLGLPFTGTNTYDFYSPPLASAVSLDTTDKGGGVVYLQNTRPSATNDFTATGRMQFFDYDPLTGTETLVVDTADSSPEDVKHGETTTCALPNALLPGNHTFPAGHLIHVAMIVTLTAGNPGRFGQVLYNGPSAPATVAYFPQKASVVLSWPFGSVAVAPPRILSIVAHPDASMALNCSAASSGTYLIQATTNLAAPSSWVTISTNVADTNGLFQFTDSGTTNYPFRFYRASTP